MLNRFVAATAVLGLLVFSPVTRAQSTAPRESGKNIHRDGWDRIVPAPPKTPTTTPGPAPVHDLSGIWEPIPGYRDGVFATGPKQYPSDGKPEHELPFTPEGLKAWKSHKPGFGTTAVPIADNNDPFDICDPIGFPRLELFNLRAIQAVEQQEPGADRLPKRSGVAEHLDGRASASERDPGAPLVRIFSRQMGGRHHFGGRHDRVG